ncbi:protein-tyrosine phosphatase-like protein [Scenedesmus sp. NREL 46B-D3]|nr:protein-tyrosine phosphatase-like protein [Scenedesmus sp. NREL 46B-D3]
MKKRDREEACSTCGHYHDYEGGEPCSICGHVLIPAGGRGHESCMPTTILSGFLYLGSYDTASRQELLKAIGITHILNTVPTCPALYKNTFTYHTVELAPPEFDECFNFLDDVQREEKKVLVYCMSGVTRSPTVVIAYLMKLRGWRLAESYKWVKDKRPQINISEGDTKRLQALEMQMHGSCSAPSGFAFMSLPALAPTEQQQQQQPDQQQQQQQQQPASCFGSGQPQWPGAGNSSSPAAFVAANVGMPFSAPGNFVFGAAQPAAHGEGANEMES